MTQEELFKKLAQLNVNEFVEEKNGLKYLSWASAWEQLLKVVPDAVYKVRMFETERGEQLPYCGNSEHGYMVFTEVTCLGLTRECWLPVMDNRNKTILVPTSFDINKAIMRCLAKNISMFGLGLYIYKGEDLPTEFSEPITEAQKKRFEELGVNIENTLRYYKVKSIDELTTAQADFVIKRKESK